MTGQLTLRDFVKRGARLEKPTVNTVGANNMTTTKINYHHLTNNELINQLTLRRDLTDIEHELLDRLIRAVRALEDLEDKQ